MPRLVHDWRRVVLVSISFWMQVAGLLALILPEARFRWTGQDSDPYFSWWLGVLLLLAGIVGRVYPQSTSRWREWLRLAAVAGLVVILALILAAPSNAATPGAVAPDAYGSTEAEALRIAVPFIAKAEGKSNVAYLDTIAVPPVWTIGYGSTEGVRPGMVITDRQALDLLQVDVAKHRTGLRRYFTPATLTLRLPPPRDAAYTSTAYNCGVTAIGNSTATRRLNSGDIAGGCEALTWWNKAGGRVVRGLFERRKGERALCLQGL
jgi:GH24 family phage-related lysozyme (muramidase)